MEITNEMLDQSPPNDPAPCWTPRQGLEQTAALLGALSRLIVEEIERDIARLESLDAFEGAYLQAYWRDVGHCALKSRPGKVDVPASTVEQVEAQRLLIQKVFRVKLGAAPPSSELKTDVAERLEWLKQCVARDFESGVFNIVDRQSASLSKCVNLLKSKTKIGVSRPTF